MHIYIEIKKEIMVWEMRAFFKVKRRLQRRFSEKNPKDCLPRSSLRDRPREEGEWGVSRV